MTLAPHEPSDFGMNVNNRNVVPRCSEEPRFQPLQPCRCSAAQQNGNRQFAVQLAAIEARWSARAKRVAPRDAVLSDGKFCGEACAGPVLAAIGDARKVPSGHDQLSFADSKVSVACGSGTSAPPAKSANSCRRNIAVA